jgi:hypothetical protein
VLVVAWIAVCAAAAAAACRRLRVPWPAIPLFLAWPPFAEGIVVGNVQVILFLCFVLLFFRHDGRGAALRPTPRDPAEAFAAGASAVGPSAGGRGALSAVRTPALRDGVLATAIAAFKVAQLAPWAYLLLRRPRAALLGAGVVGLVVLGTLPFVGLAAWGDWLAQVRRAADPDWRLAGISLGRYVGQAAGLAVFGLSIALVSFVPRERAGAWVGLLAVLGAPSLHMYGLLFMLPAMLAIRRESALVAAVLVSTYTEAGTWLAIAIVALTFVGSTRWPRLAEPTAGPRGSAPLEARGVA